MAGRPTPQGRSAELQMSVLIDSCTDLTLESFRQVTFERAPVGFSAGCLERIAWAHEAFQRYLDANRDSFVYGITSGYGPEADRRYTLEESRQRWSARPSWWGLAFGGPPLPEYVSRGAVFASSSSLVTGNAAVHPDQARAVLGLLDGPLPGLPSRGLTAAGELMPNSILFDLLPAATRFTAGWGFHTEAAMTAIAALMARRRLRFAECVLALSIEAFRAPLDAYDPALKSLWGDHHEAQALDALGALLKGAGAKRRPYQAPISFRIVPRVLGQAHRAVSALEELAEVALRSDASNPTFLPPDTEHPIGRVLSTGSFHNAAAAPAIDAIVRSWADLGGLIHRHAINMHRSRVSLLPDRLIPPGADSSSSTYSTTYLEYLPNGFVEEMRRLSQPTLISTSDTAASMQDDVPITTALAFVNERRAAECFDMTIAVLAVIASQALHITDATAAPALSPFLDTLREIVPPVESQRRLGADCAQLAEALSEAVEYRPSPFQTCL